MDIKNYIPYKQHKTNLYVITVDIVGLIHYQLEESRSRLRNILDDIIDSLDNANFNQDINDVLIKQLLEAGNALQVKYIQENHIPYAREIVMNAYNRPEEIEDYFDLETLIYSCSEYCCEPLINAKFEALYSNLKLNLIPIGNNYYSLSMVSKIPEQIHILLSYEDIQPELSTILTINDKLEIINITN